MPSGTAREQGTIQGFAFPSVRRRRSRCAALATAAAEVAEESLSARARASVLSAKLAIGRIER